ncbi:hypothetical protein D3C87_1451990 [compost metagenome]
MGAGHQRNRIRQGPGRLRRRSPQGGFDGAGGPLGQARAFRGRGRRRLRAAGRAGARASRLRLRLESGWQIQGPDDPGRRQGRRHAGHAGSQATISRTGRRGHWRHQGVGHRHLDRPRQPGRAGPAPETGGRVDGAVVSADRRDAARHATVFHGRSPGGQAEESRRRGVRLQGFQRQGRQ